MSPVANVTIHASQFPEAVRRDLLESLRARQVNHKFHYDRSEERRVGKGCRCLSDWSSDVCSSDLCPFRAKRSFSGCIVNLPKGLSHDEVSATTIACRRLPTSPFTPASFLKRCAAICSNRFVRGR